MSTLDDLIAKGLVEAVDVDASTGYDATETDPNTARRLSEKQKFQKQSIRPQPYTRLVLDTPSCVVHEEWRRISTCWRAFTGWRISGRCQTRAVKNQDVLVRSLRQLSSNV